MATKRAASVFDLKLLLSLVFKASYTTFAADMAFSAFAGNLRRYLFAAESKPAVWNPTVRVCVSRAHQIGALKSFTAVTVA